MLRQPEFLEKGQSIGIIACGGKIKVDQVQVAIRTFKSWGLRVVQGPHLFSEYHQFAGTDQQRAHDLQAMLDNPDIRAVISARGGYGTTRTLALIDFTQFLKQPKWIIGFSDITVLHSHIHTLGIQTLHAAMPVSFTYKGAQPSINSLKKALFGNELLYTAKASRFNRAGKGQGIIVGGNLSLLVHLIGTASDISMDGKILFMEDIGEYLYHIDRMMLQLKRSGKLTKLAGLIVGQMTDMKDNETHFGRNAFEIVADAVAEYTYPVSFGFPIGHEALNMAVPCGSLAILSVTESGTQLSFSPTAV